MTVFSHLATCPPSRRSSSRGLERATAERARREIVERARERTNARVFSSRRSRRVSRTTRDAVVVVVVEFIHRPSKEFDSIDRDDDVLEAIPRDDGRGVRRVRVGARRVAARCGRGALDERGDESSRLYDPRVRGTVDDGPGSMRVPADVDELL